MAPIQLDVVINAQKRHWLDPSFFCSGGQKTVYWNDQQEIIGE